MHGEPILQRQSPLLLVLKLLTRYCDLANKGQPKCG